MHYNNADLIIAKGQGNYETLSEEKRPIAFLLKVKCPVIARDIGQELGSLSSISDMFIIHIKVKEGKENVCRLFSSVTQ